MAAVVSTLPPRVSRVEVRRLQLAAERGRCVGVLLHEAPRGVIPNIYAAASRWLISPAPGERSVQRWNVRLIRGSRMASGPVFSTWRKPTVIPFKQILCICLPHWPVSRRYRRSPRQAADNLVAIVQTIAGQRRQIVNASNRDRQGLKCGMSLAEARMLCPGLICVEHDLQGDRRVLEALGRWMNRFTPPSPLDRQKIRSGAGVSLPGCHRLRAIVRRDQQHC